MSRSASSGGRPIARRRHRARVVRHLDVVAQEQEESRRALGGVDVVVHHQHPQPGPRLARRRLLDATPFDGPGVPGREQRQAHGEGAPPPRARALRADGATVQLDQALHQREPQPEPAQRAVRALAGLEEADRTRAEPAPGRCRCHCPRPGGRASPSSRLAVHPEVPARIGVLGRVGQEVRHDLRQPRRGRRRRRIPQSGHVHREPVPPCSMSGLAVSMPWATTTPSSTARARSSTLPRVMRETSSRSSTRRQRCFTCRSMIDRSRSQRLRAAQLHELQRGDHAAPADCAARGRASPGTRPWRGSRPPRRDAGWSPARVTSVRDHRPRPRRGRRCFPQRLDHHVEEGLLRVAAGAAVIAARYAGEAKGSPVTRTCSTSSTSPCPASSGNASRKRAAEELPVPTISRVALVGELEAQLGPGEDGDAHRRLAEDGSHPLGLPLLDAPSCARTSWASTRASSSREENGLTR